MRILVINGPNLNLLGTREPEVYGTETLADLERKLVDWGAALGADIETMQSNHEGDLIDYLQRSDLDGIVLNPGAYTHTSRALGDTIASIHTPVVEVHISNVKEREPWRAVSYIEDHCDFTIFGRGTGGYRDAIRHLVNAAALPSELISYGAHPEQVGGLGGTGEEVVVLIHGGFWRQEWKRDTMETIAVDIAGRGIRTWNIEYRRLGCDGGWPASADDVVAAIDYISTKESTRSIKVIGHSAGAYMALWAATQADTPVSGVVALAPIVDLERHAKSQSVGASEAQVLLDQGAPPLAVSTTVPTFLVHGEADRHVPIGHSADLARNQGLELLTTPSGHFELLDPTRGHWEKVIEVLG